MIHFIPRLVSCRSTEKGSQHFKYLDSGYNYYDAIRASRRNGRAEAGSQISRWCRRLGHPLGGKNQLLGLDYNGS